MAYHSCNEKTIIETPVLANIKTDIDTKESEQYCQAIQNHKCGNHLADSVVTHLDDYADIK